jgi:hypothetical protein
LVLHTDNAKELPVERKAMKLRRAEKIGDEPWLTVVHSEKVLESRVLRHIGNPSGFERDQFRWLGVDEDSKVAGEEVDFGEIRLVSAYDPTCELKGDERKPLEGGERVELREHPFNRIHLSGVSQGLPVVAIPNRPRRVKPLQLGGSGAECPRGHIECDLAFVEGTTRRRSSCCSSSAGTDNLKKDTNLETHFGNRSGRRAIPS